MIQNYLISKKSKISFSKSIPKIVERITVRFCVNTNALKLILILDKVNIILTHSCYVLNRNVENLEQPESNCVCINLLNVMKDILVGQMVLNSILYFIHTIIVS